VLVLEMVNWLENHFQELRVAEMPAPPVLKPSRESGGKRVGGIDSCVRHDPHDQDLG
jgi:hypothetical protein